MSKETTPKKPLVRPSSLPPLERTSLASNPATSQHSAELPQSVPETNLFSNNVFTSYNKEELDEQIKDAFRDRQRQRRERQVNHLVLGKGLGAAAEQSLKAGLYQPSKVLEPITEAEAKMWDSLDLAKAKTTLDALQEEEEENSRRSKFAPSMIKVENRGRLGDTRDDPTLNPQFTDRLRQTVEPVSVLAEVRKDVEDNVAAAERELRQKCAPFSLEEVHETLFNGLIALERGNAKEKVSLPMYIKETPSFDVREREAQRKEEAEHPVYLVGAEAVLKFLRESVLPVAYEVLPLSHATLWVAQYTITFLRSLVTRTEAEAKLRVELLARCVRLVGLTESFSAILLSMQSKSEEYDAFVMLRDSAEEHLSSLMSGIDEGLDAVLACRFPHRRARLLLIERGVKAKLQRALLFMNELDYNWSPNVRFHAEWKEKFLSDIFRHIHDRISARFVYCSMGFIDECLYDKVKDFRVPGKGGGKAEVLRARVVEQEKVVERLTFEQIGMAIKGYASIVVGLQLCLGARYILKQCTPEYDEAWGFPMHEETEGPSEETVNKTVDAITKQAKQKADPSTKEPTREKKTAFFLTQDEDED